jgi:hypothetical protein
MGLAVILTALLGGCAATVKKADDAAPLKVGPDATKSIVLTLKGEKDATDDKDWESFKEIWREAMREEVAGIGATFTAQEGEPKPSGASGTLLAVGLGIMTGNAFVNADVSFRDLSTGQVWGERHYDTTSSAWQGVFAPMTDKQVHAICKEIVSTLSSH